MQTGDQIQTSHSEATAKTSMTKRAAPTARPASGHGRTETHKLGARVRLCAAARRRSHSFGATSAPVLEAGSAERSARIVVKQPSLMTPHPALQLADARRGDPATRIFKLDRLFFLASYAKLYFSEHNLNSK